MDSRNDYIRDYCGITAWHKAGYTGYNVSIASGEDFITDSKPSDHAFQTYQAAREAAPDASYSYLPTGNRAASGMTQDEFNAYIDNEIRDKDISIWWRSISSGTYTGFDKRMEAHPELCIFASAGNTGDDNGSDYIGHNTVYGVGAVNITWTAMKNGEPMPGAELVLVPAGYSSESEHVDFTAPSGLYLGECGKLDGTSFSAPFLAGMCALVNDFFIDKTGRPLTREKMYQFLKDCSEDLTFPGHDSKTGWGLPVLPPPDSVDISKYTEGDREDMFKDCVGHWAEKYINRCVEAGLINGYEDGTFRPNENITRAEMAAVMAKLLEMKGE